MPRVVCQEWEESERGWGCRPDGYTLHLTEQDRAAYVQAHWDSLPDGRAPSVYSRPRGTPYEIDVDDETLAKVESSSRGYAFDGLPADAGPDGWQRVKL